MNPIIIPVLEMVAVAAPIAAACRLIWKYAKELNFLRASRDLNDIIKEMDRSSREFELKGAEVFREIHEDTSKIELFLKGELEKIKHERRAVDRETIATIERIIYKNNTMVEEIKSLSRKMESIKVLAERIQRKE